VGVAVAGTAPVATPPPLARRRGRPSLLLVVVAALVGAAFAAPFGYLVARNAAEGGDVVAVLTSRRALEPLARSLVLGVTVAAASAVLGTTLAWLLTRTDLPGRRMWQALVPLPLVIPSFVGAAALVAAFARGGLVHEVTGVGDLPNVRGFTGAFLVLTLLSYPYVFLTTAARLASMAPGLEESARLLGRRPLAVFRTVVLPQASGAIWAGTLLTFLYVLSDFGAVSIVRYDALTRAIYSARLDPTTSVPLSLVLGLLALAVVAGERALGRRRPATDAGRAKRALRVPLRRWRWPALALLAATVTGALVAPVTVLAWWAWRGLTNDEAAVSALVADPGGLVEPVLRTAGVGLLTAVVAIAVVLPVARLSVRFRGRFTELPGALVVGGFALPGLVTALALVFWVRQLPASLGLYQTLPVLVTAYVLHFGAQSLRASQVAVAGVPGRVEDAARMLGARGVRRFATIELPIMLPGLLAGAGMVLLSTMKELPATLLLAPIGFETLATRIWGANNEGFLAETGLTSLVLLALSGVLTWLLVLRRAEHL
jgi:iron(III) transport system permease protein